MEGGGRKKGEWWWEGGGRKEVDMEKEDGHVQDGNFYFAFGEGEKRKGE